MVDRKPNNLPWIILGVICGILLAGLFALGVYEGVTATSLELEYVEPEPSDKELLYVGVSTSGVFFSLENKSNIRNQYESYEAFKKFLSAKETVETKKLAIIQNGKKASENDLLLKALVEELDYEIALTMTATK